MNRYVAFLRGMNTGRRRIKNEGLCACFEALGYANVSAFLASGNVVFDAQQAAPAKVTARIEAGLRSQLDYEVPTFLRTTKEVKAIAAYDPFADAIEGSVGKPQVAMLARRPSAAARQKVLALSTEADRLALRGRELYWLPSGSILDSELDMAAVEAALGPMTTRTRRTVERLVAKYLSD